LLIQEPLPSVAFAFAFVSHLDAIGLDSNEAVPFVSEKSVSQTQSKKTEGGWRGITHVCSAEDIVMFGTAVEVAGCVEERS
jgi:hypothetical protein